MYNITVYFDVQPGGREDFIMAALEDGSNSVADEPGTQRLELIVDEENPNRFYLNEAYDDPEAFDVHANGPHFARFYEVIESIKDYVDGPTRLIRGTRVENSISA
jgi:(4S)-4-hydroxy-5-phosphonooxypentane-2,3-dione isomerase